MFLKKIACKTFASTFGIVNMKLLSLLFTNSKKNGVGKADKNILCTFK